MLFLTNNFIFNIKYYYGSLEFVPNSSIDINWTKLRDVTASCLLRIKSVDMSFYVFNSYNWINKHLTKIKEAFNHPKWMKDDCPFIRGDNVEYSKKMRKNRIVLTNIFSNNFIAISYDEKIKYEPLINGAKTSNDLFENIGNDDGGFVFTKQYLSGLKNKKQPDSKQALADYSIYCVDLNKNKFVCDINFNQKNIDALDKDDLAKMAINTAGETVRKNVSDAIKLQMVRAASMLALQTFTLNMLRMNMTRNMSMNSMRMMNTFRKF